MASTAFPVTPAEPRPGLGWPIIAVLVAAVGSAGLLVWAVGDRIFAGAFLAGLVGLGALLLIAARLRKPTAIVETPRADIALLRADQASSVTRIAFNHGVFSSRPLRRAKYRSNNR